MTDRIPGPADSAAAPATHAPLPLRPWSALAFPNFRLLWLSNGAISGAFSMRQMVNLWQVYEISGSAVQLGLTGLFQAAPFLTIGLVAGNVADAVDRKKLLIATQVLNCLLALILGALTLTGHIAVWHIYAITTLTSVLNVFSNPTRQTLVANVVPRGYLMNAMSLNTILSQTGVLLGPLIGGVVLGFSGSGTVYLVNAVVIVGTIAALAAIHPTISTGKRPRVDARAVIEGFRFFWATKALLGLVLLDMAATMFGGYTYLLPVFATDILLVDEFGFGLLAAAPAIGALVGAVGLAVFASVRHRGLMVIGSTAGFALALVALGLSRSFPLTLGIVIVLGLCNAFGVVIRPTTVQTIAPDHLRGRVAGASQIFSAGGTSMGATVAGFLAGAYGADGAVMVGGAIVGAIVLAVAVVFGSLRRFQA